MERFIELCFSLSVMIISLYDLLKVAVLLVEFSEAGLIYSCLGVGKQLFKIEMFFFYGM